MPTVANYEALANRHTDLIRKALEGSVFFAPATEPLPTALTSASGALNALTSNWVDVGWCDQKTGASWGSKVTTSDVDSWGAVEPTRRDIVRVDRTLKFLSQETNKTSLALKLGVDPASMTLDSSTKELQVTSPQRPALIYWRALGIFQDGSGSDAIYIARLCPRVTVTDIGDEVWSPDNVAASEITMTAFTDNTAGYAMRSFFGGPGWISRATEMGFS
ncbi:hypothetical protein GCM10010174_61460 [Kutzneria viridogrisea]|uniref:Uncharacterized protein n=1 Tax=Kutzneria viridogrisea TaxID=47990 RepID=A0ABR6BGE3_9PSEU|nr:hypothetical protein [Kutzneria viridogrisea]